jgi:hypothetical protein
MKNLKSQKIGISLVIFLDVLGIKSKLQKMETDEDFKKIYNQINYVKNEFAKESDELGKKYEKSIGKTVQVFSDCVVISLSLESEIADNIGTFDPFLAELHHFGLCQMTCVCNDIFIRGGISIGYWYYENNILISPALLDAYDLEREVSVYPVLTISRDAFNLFKNHPHRNYYSEDIEPIKRLFRKYKATSGRFFYCLDYLGIGYSGAADWYTNDDLRKYRAERNGDKKHEILSESYKKNQKHYLLGHKNAILRAIKTFKDQKVLNKYLWLVKFHNNFFKQIEPYFRDVKIRDSEIEIILN